MHPLSDAELERLLVDVESYSVERKESLKGDAPSKIRETVCAFANDLPGTGRPGVLFVGAKDDGAPAALAVTDELLLQLAEVGRDGNIVPPPTMDVRKANLRGADFAVVTVWPSDSPPVRYRGRICVRNGPRRDVATAQDERVLNERRRYGDAPFDRRPVRGAVIADLDLRRFRDEYLPAAFAADVLAANERTTEQRLAATKMAASADDPVPTVVGVLTLSFRVREFLPGAYVQFVRLAGADELSPVTDRAEIGGTLDETIRRTEEKLSAHNSRAVDFTSTAFETARDAYPAVALQQLVRNAVMHRSYESTNAPIRVTWYSDRLEIVSPGGPYGAVTVENFGGPGVTDYRNPNVAEALRVLGFVQRFGMGIAVARAALKANGNPPPEFIVTPSFVRAVLRPVP